MIRVWECFTSHNSICSNKNTGLSESQNNSSTESEDCAICLEHRDQSSYMRFGCGHKVCIACLLQMLGVTKCKGTLLNIMKHALHYNNNGDSGIHRKCPFCRRPIIPRTCTCRAFSKNQSKQWSIEYLDP